MPILVLLSQNAQSDEKVILSRCTVMCIFKTDCPISLFSAAAVVARVEISDLLRHRITDESQRLP